MADIELTRQKLPSMIYQPIRIPPPASTLRDWFKRNWLGTRIKLPNPVYELEYRPLRWPRTERELRRYTILMVAGLSALACVLAVIDNALFCEDSLTVMVYVLLVANVGLALASDIYMMLVAVNKIGRQ